MNKKILFLILLGVLVLPTTICAQVDSIANSIKTAAISVGWPMVVVGWIVAGVLYLTSAGSPERTGTAKKALVAAVIGTVLVILAQNAASFVAGTFGL